jgi:hypothetical protein
VYQDFPYAVLVVKHTKNGSGNTTEELYFGGDTSSPGISTDPEDACSSGNASRQYGFRHTYAFGALQATNYIASGGQNHVVQPVNRTIDLSTGLPSRALTYRR